MTPVQAFSKAIALISEDLPSGVITVNRNGQIIAQNRASERIFERELSGATLRDMVREPDDLQLLLDRCINSGEVFRRVEFNVPIGPQREKHIGINLSPITSSQGDIEGVICLLSDLTEIVEFQNQVKLKENFAALGEISAGIAHEFKNSIATILGYAQMSANENSVDELHGYAREIQKESRAMSIMVTDFLNFARPVDPSIVNVSLLELLEAVIADIRTSRPGAYEIRMRDRGQATLPCDATLMRQLFFNLLLNAVDAAVESPDGTGEVSVSLEQTWERDSSSVRITVEDNGSGIQVHHLTKIFYPFFTTKSHGTGLGLSLVQKIVLAHNGRIEARNVAPHGALFVVTFPLPS